MDSRGHWHNEPSLIDRAMNPQLAEVPPRFVIALTIGSTVEVTRGDDKLLAVFEGANKNKVTLRPIDEAGKVRSYFELAEKVFLSDGSAPGVEAQVWDNRDGKIILRTLPVR